MPEHRIIILEVAIEYGIVYLKQKLRNDTNIQPHSTKPRCGLPEHIILLDFLFIQFGEQVFYSHNPFPYPSNLHLYFQAVRARKCVFTVALNERDDLGCIYWRVGDKL